MSESDPGAILGGIVDAARSRFDAPDIARSVGSGARQAASDLIGIPGDLQAGVNSVFDSGREFIESRLGISGTPEQTAALRLVRAQAPSLLPQSATVNAAMTPYVGPQYVPQTRLGDIAQGLVTRAGAMAAPAMVGIGPPLNGLVAIMRGAR